MSGAYFVLAGGCRDDRLLHLWNAHRELQMTFATLVQLQALRGGVGGFGVVNSINDWAEPHNANGVTPNTPIDSNTEPPRNNMKRGY
eukprot:CAMPEP_0114555400 /NCGR_PEP_ID=MMETSP0114-20121206/8729_1 /TAXON_ID=31324 /ORGANISM="Goniomonas sp, Strain m" /LENGTH=86 /DNA_ID=CAMNT_0001740523 /DNA_START=25 /DNA_END=286 /DNA_ORIENTATION=+